MKSWLESNTGVSSSKVKELVWWQEEKFEGEGGDNFTVVFTPANHWCKRGVLDDNKVVFIASCLCPSFSS